MSSMHRQVVVCGVDIGSTNTKVVAIDEGGRVLARAQRATPRHATDLSIDAVEVLRLIETMLLEVCGSRYRLRAVCVAGVGEDGVPVDAALEPLDAALSWFDPRRTRVYAAIEPLLSASPEIGVADDAARTIVGWAWARQHGGLQRATGWAALTDYAAVCWTGRLFMSDTLAARTAAWDGSARSWLMDRVQATLGDTALLPEVVPTGTTLGPLRNADHLHDAGVLTTDAVVVAGGHDHPIGGWAIDQVDTGALLDSMGTAEVVVAQAQQWVPRNAGVDVAPGIRQPGTSLLSVEEFTRNVDWASLDPDVRQQLRLLADGSVKPDGYLESEAFVAGGRGGVRPQYALDAPADARSRASAVLGALARMGAEAIDEVADLMPASSPVYVAGGWSRAAGWVAIKERISQRRMRVVGEPEVPAVGAALLAASAIGWDVPAGAALGMPD